MGLQLPLQNMAGTGPNGHYPTPGAIAGVGGMLLPTPPAQPLQQQHAALLAMLGGGAALSPALAAAIAAAPSLTGGGGVARPSAGAAVVRPQGPDVFIRHPQPTPDQLSGGTSGQTLVWWREDFTVEELRAGLPKYAVAGATAV